MKKQTNNKLLFVEKINAICLCPLSPLSNIHYCLQCFIKLSLVKPLLPVGNLIQAHTTRC